MIKTKVLLVGPILTRSGYGEQTRFALRALRTREDIFDIFIHPLTWGQTSWIHESDDERKWIDEAIEKTVLYSQQSGQYDISVQVTIPNEWKNLAMTNIGYTAGIEATRVHPDWISAVNGMDKVITVSNFSKDVFTSSVYQDQNNPSYVLAAETEINVVNYPVKTHHTYQELDLNCLRYDTNFLCVAQWGPRKNLDNTIKWFIEEFKNDEVGLVIKTNMAKNCLMDREICEGQLKSLVQQASNGEEVKCNIVLLHGDMTDDEMHSLYKNEKIKAFVAIPHGEGYGLPIFEAAYSGLPVVSIGWSGQADYLYDLPFIDENKQERFYSVGFDIGLIQKEAVWDGILIKEAGWAYAREESYKEAIRQCYNDVLSNTGHVAKASEYAADLHERFKESDVLESFIEAMGINVDEELEWANQLSEIEIL